MYVNWTQLGLAGVLGIVVGLVVLLSGLWMDRRRERRFNREVQGLSAVSGAAAGAVKGLRRMDRAIRMIRGLRRGA